MFYPRFSYFVLYILFFFLLCEYLSYFFTLSLCKWPKISENTSSSVLKAMILADTHLLGVRHGHWFDKVRREWQMHRSFQTARFLFQPEVFFFLGDVFDEGVFSGRSEFQRYFDRFQSLFHVDRDEKVVAVPGNHDIGFHYEIRPGLLNDFATKFRFNDSVQHLRLKSFDFILLNSMAMENDGCQLCEKAKKSLMLMAEKLESLHPRPILMQHFPLFRKSDSLCAEPDQAPLNEKYRTMRENWEVLSEEATGTLLDSVKPRAVFGGHSHNGCTLWHGEPYNFWEHTVSSFSWRNRNNPAFLLVSISDESVAVSKCLLPQESSVILIYIVASVLLLFWIVSASAVKLFETWKASKKYH